MPGEAVSEAILIIAGVIMIGVLAGSVYLSISYIGSAVDASSLAGSQRLLTDIQIVFATNTTSTTVYVYLQNIGEQPVENLGLGTLYFGLENQQQPVGYGGPAPSWTTNTQTLNPGSTATIVLTLSQALTKGSYYTVMYVTQNGAQAEYTFQVV
jgi:flagellar protein FlaG